MLARVQASGCSKQELRDECRAPANGNVLAAQLLFSVYVHSRPDHSARRAVCWRICQGERMMDCPCVTLLSGQPNAFAGTRIEMIRR